MDYSYTTSGPVIYPKIKMVAQKLIITAMPKKKGDMIYGSLYFKGKCESDCHEDVEIIGDFKGKL